MSALVELISGKYLGSRRPVRMMTQIRTAEGILEEEREVRVQYTRDRVGALLPLGTITQLTGQDAGSNIDGTELERGQLVRIRPPEGLIDPLRYQVIISWNPVLAELGTVQAPPIVQPDEENIQLVFRPYKKVDLGELDYIFHLYMID